MAAATAREMGKIMLGRYCAWGGILKGPPRTTEAWLSGAAGLARVERWLDITCLLAEVVVHVPTECVCWLKREEKSLRLETIQIFRVVCAIYKPVSDVDLRRQVVIRS